MTTDKINPNKNEAYDAIVTRTSVRQYLNDAPVPEVLVEALLRAAMSAPTAVNSQPWAFVVVNDRDVLDRLGAALPYARMLSRAPLAIVSCGVGDKFLSGDDEPLWVQDLSAASENILIAANAFGRRRVVFFTHQPMTRNTAALKAYSGVLDMLKEYDVLILTGHLHRIFNNFPEYAPTIKERNHVALGGYEWRGPCSQDGVPNGYYIYHVDGTDISWKYKWTGKDADKNMFRLYEPGQFGTPVYAPSEDKTIIVNVWDWDEDWKVTWSLDGVDMGAAERQDEAEDPWAIYSFANDPAHPTWVAKPTYHIFHCNVPASGSVVKVTVADPFGRELSKTITLESDPSGGIEAIAPESCGVLAVEIYNMQGIKVLTVDGYPEADTLPLEHGCYIMRLHHTDGSLSTEKITR